MKTVLHAALHKITAETVELLPVFKKIFPKTTKIYQPKDKNWDKLQLESFNRFVLNKEFFLIVVGNSNLPRSQLSFSSVI